MTGLKKLQFLIDRRNASSLRLLKAHNEVLAAMQQVEHAMVALLDFLSQDGYGRCAHAGCGVTISRGADFCVAHKVSGYETPMKLCPHPGCSRQIYLESRTCRQHRYSYPPSLRDETPIIHAHD